MSSFNFAMIVSCVLLPFRKLLRFLCPRRAARCSDPLLRFSAPASELSLSYPACGYPGAVLLFCGVKGKNLFPRLVLSIKCVYSRKNHRYKNRHKKHQCITQIHQRTCLSFQKTLSLRITFSLGFLLTLSCVRKTEYRCQPCCKSHSSITQCFSKIHIADLCQPKST